MNLDLIAMLTMHIIIVGIDYFSY